MTRWWRLAVYGIAVVALMACGDATGGTGIGAKALSVVGEPSVTRPSPGLVMVAGRVKNEAQRAYSGQVMVTLFDASGKVVGTCTGAVNDVAPGDEVTYQAMGVVDAAVTWTKVEPKISLQIPR